MVYPRYRAMDMWCNDVMMYGVGNVCCDDVMCNMCLIFRYYTEQEQAVNGKNN